MSIQFLFGQSVTGIREFIVVVASEERKNLPELSEPNAIEPQWAWLKRVP